jgi:putative addiction module CopG family antidote
MAAAQVAAGRFASVDDALRAGMRALDRQQREAAELDALRAAIDEGDNSPDAPDGVFERVRARAGLPVAP